MITRCLLNSVCSIQGKLIAVHGTVVRVSNIKPLAVQMAFTCNTCGDMQVDGLIIVYCV